MAVQHGLFRYYRDQKWAEEFLNGRFRFWSLGYFRDLEEQGIRGDANEGQAHFRPSQGLQITNKTRGMKFTMPGHGLTSVAKQEEIFVFCASRSLSAELWQRFEARVCLEIPDVSALCARVQAGLPSGAHFPGRPGRERIGQRVEYYRVTDSADTRWALPDRIASSKLSDLAWQDEFRLIFSLTDGLAFENVSLTIAPKDAAPPPRSATHEYHDASVGSLRDLCRVHTSGPAGH